MTKSRKRMLLSSIAMLLVALVALGSATYAWFSINKTVTADTIQVKAVAAEGLVINNKKTADWQPAVSFEGRTSLVPISYAITLDSVMPTGYIAETVQENGGIWRSTDTTKEATDFVAATDDIPSGSAATGDYLFNKSNYVAAYTVQVASSGTTGIDRAVNASIAFDAGDNTFAKAALVDSTGNVVCFYTDGQAYDAISAIGTVATTAAPAARLTKASVLSTVPTQANAATFTLYVWYEGNDPQCLDAKLANDASAASFTISFTLAD